MSFAHLSLPERCERARRLEYKIHGEKFDALDNSVDDDEWDFVFIDAWSDEDRALDSSSRFITFFRAALTIRLNYPQWLKFVKAPSSGPPPMVFEPFADDSLLLFFLHFCDYTNIVNLNPQYPFMICEKSSPEVFAVHIKNLDQANVMKTLEKMWLAFGSPLRDTYFKLHFDSPLSDTESDESCEDCDANELKELFIDLLEQFDFAHIAYDENDYDDLLFIDKVYFIVPELIANASVALAYDNSEVNTLEIMRELFPTFPDFVSRIAGKYVKALTRKLPPHYTIPRSSKARRVLEERFNCEIRYETADNGHPPPLHHQSILSTVKDHPEFFIWWAGDPELSTIYSELIKRT